MDENWQMWRQFVIEQQQLALDADGSSSSKALSSPVETPDEIQSHFGTISYSKGMDFSTPILVMVFRTNGNETYLYVTVSTLIAVIVFCWCRKQYFNIGDIM